MRKRKRGPWHSTNGSPGWNGGRGVRTGSRRGWPRFRGRRQEVGHSEFLRRPEGMARKTRRRISKGRGRGRRGKGGGPVRRDAVFIGEDEDSKGPRSVQKLQRERGKEGEKREVQKKGYLYRVSPKKQRS